MRVHATFSVAQARQVVYAAACKEWQLGPGEIPWELRFIQKEIEPGHYQYRWFLKRSQYSQEIEEFEVTQKNFGGYWYIVQIRIQEKEMFSMNYQIERNEVTGVSFDREIMIVVGDQVVMSHGTIFQFEYKTVKKDDLAHWKRYLPKWARDKMLVNTYSGPPAALPAIAKVGNIPAELTSGSVHTFGLSTYEVLNIDDFAHMERLPWENKFRPEPVVEDERMAIAMSLALHHAGLLNRIKENGGLFIWDLMPYGEERGKILLEAATADARQVLVDRFPDLDPDEAIRRYLAGERVFSDVLMARAVAQTAVRLPDKRAEEVGKPMGTLCHPYTSLVYCETNDVMWVNEHNPRGSDCPCCGAEFTFRRGANAWPAYTLTTPNHTYVLVEQLPFDDQKRYSRDVNFRTARFPVKETS